MLVSNLVTGIGGETGNGKLVTQVFNGPAQQCNRLLAQLQNALLASFRNIVQRLGQIQQQHHRNITTIMLVTHIDSWIRLGACLEVDK